MPVNGFDDAKNKVSVHTTVEIENIVNDAKTDVESDLQPTFDDINDSIEDLNTDLTNGLAEKQDKHITTTATLTAADWALNSNLGVHEQYVQVTGVTETNTILVSPSPVNYLPYNKSLIRCIGQGTGGGGSTSDSLRFACDSDYVPTADITINILILGV